jgi:3-hydroxyisobutyrate dehydrogenase-like beta-hydroxyacid dehydrogenase
MGRTVSAGLHGHPLDHRRRIAAHATALLGSIERPGDLAQRGAVAIAVAVAVAVAGNATSGELGGDLGEHGPIMSTGCDSGAGLHPRAGRCQTAPMSFGIVHPGAMGSSLGAALVAQGHEVMWASEGRSAATRARAEADGLVDVGSLAALVDRVTTLVSVCPPGDASAVAADVTAAGFTGVYVDANAIAPATARRIEALVHDAGATFVDGGIIGPPARHRGLTVLYLSGATEPCARLAEAFGEGPVMTQRVAGSAGAASAVKVAFAAWTKGTSALLLAARALAEAEGVTEGLDHAWSVLTPELVERLPVTAAGTAPKAWRFVGEMQEIAAAFEDAGLPGGFHHAAASIYEALAGLRDADDVDTLDVLRRLVGPPEATGAAEAGRVGA